MREMRRAGHEPPIPALEAALAACRDQRQWVAALEILEDALVPIASPRSAAEVGNELSRIVAGEQPPLVGASDTAAEEPTRRGVGMPGGGFAVKTRGDDELIRNVAAAAAAAARDSHGSSGNGRLRALAMEACVACGEWRAALRVFDAVREVGTLPGATEWRAALRAFARGGLWRRALSALPVMARSGIGYILPELAHLSVTVTVSVTAATCSACACSCAYPCSCSCVNAAHGKLACYICICICM